ncbi:MAG: FkbM family methyltransferase [Pseudonocardiaceae bacterium]
MSAYPPPKFDTIAYGGNAEDVVLVRAFAGKRNGFFVDVGAGEPDMGSLTKNLVDRFGWRGVNIEPLPDRFDMLVKARPLDVNLAVAVSTEPGRAVFHRILPTETLHGGAGLSTLEPEIVNLHRRTGWSVEDFEVDVVTLESVLSEHVTPGFDLLKVDVEGSEAAVLASADLRTWRPRVVVVEATLPDTTIPSHEDWEPQLLDRGYVLALFDGLNRFYARADEPDLAARLSTPANVTDRFIPAAYAQLLGLQT